MDAIGMDFCIICCDIVNAKDDSINIPAASACQHPNKACRMCWQVGLQSQLNYVQPQQFGCVQCNRPLTHAEFKLRAAPETYQSYTKVLARFEKAKGKTSRKCIAEGCDSRQVLTDNDGSVFTCEICKHKHCILCHMPIHEGLSCDADLLDRHLAGVLFEVGWKAKRKEFLEAHKEEEKASSETIRKVCKECPKCGTRIEKSGGCERMECLVCKHCFCWLCLQDYAMIDVKGSSFHGPKCPIWNEDGDARPQHVDAFATVEGDTAADEDSTDEDTVDEDTTDEDTLDEDTADEDTDDGDTADKDASDKDTTNEDAADKGVADKDAADKKATDEAWFAEAQATMDRLMRAREEIHRLMGTE